MPETDVELLHRVNAVYNGEGIEAVVDYYTEDFEWHSPPEWPEDPVYFGHDGLRKIANAWFESFDEYHWDEHQLVPVPDGRVVGLYRHRGRIKDGGAQIDQPIGVIWQLRDGKIARAVSYSRGRSRYGRRAWTRRSLTRSARAPTAARRRGWHRG